MTCDIINIWQYGCLENRQDLSYTAPGFRFFIFPSSLRYPNQNTTEFAQIKTKNIDFQCTLIFLYLWLKLEIYDL